MNKLVAALSVTTAVFAVSTFYLAYELYRRAPEDSRTPIAVAARSVAEPRDPPVTSTDSRAATSPAAQNSVTPEAPSAEPRPSGDAEKKADPARASMLPFARQFLERLDDGVQRETVFAEAEAGLRRQYAPLKEQLKLDAATFDQFLELLAEQTITIQEKYFRCIVDPACDFEGYGKNAAVQDPSQALLSLLGPEKMTEFERYRSRIGERDAVTQLRGLLNESDFLRDGQAEKLISALAEVREQYQAQAAQRGTTLNGWGTSLGMLMYPNDVGSLDQRLHEATQYSQRLRERAATVLTPTQLEIFVQIQDELLAQMASYMKPASSS